MAISGAHFTLKPGSTKAAVLSWVYDPRRASAARAGINAGPTIEDVTVISVNVGVSFLADFLAPAVVPAIADFFATVEWSSGGKEIQSVDFDCLKGGSISMPAARVAVYLNYVLGTGIDASTMPDAEINVTLGRQPTGKQRPRRTLQFGSVGAGGGASVLIPSYADSVAILSDQTPLVVGVVQSQGNLTVSQQNVSSSTQSVPVDSLADMITANNNGAVAARLAARFELSL